MPRVAFSTNALLSSFLYIKGHILVILVYLHLHCRNLITEKSNKNTRAKGGKNSPLLSMFICNNRLNYVAEHETTTTLAHASSESVQVTMLCSSNTCQTSYSGEPFCSP